MVTEGKLAVNVVAKDPEDNKFLGCALEGNADYLVGGDDHLLEVKDYEGRRIVPPTTFLALLQPA